MTRCLSTRKPGLNGTAFDMRPTAIGQMKAIWCEPPEKKRLSFSFYGGMSADDARDSTNTRLGIGSRFDDGR